MEGSLHRVAPQPALRWQGDLSLAAVSYKKKDKYIHHLQNRQLLRPNSCPSIPFLHSSWRTVLKFVINPPINSSALRIKSNLYSSIWLLHSFLIPSPMLPPAHGLLTVPCARDTLTLSLLTTSSLSFHLNFCLSSLLVTQSKVAPQILPCRPVLAVCTAHRDCAVLFVCSLSPPVESDVPGGGELVCLVFCPDFGS